MQPANRSVVALVYDQLCMFEFAVAAELFGLERPELGVKWYDFSVVSVHDAPVRTLGGVQLDAPADLSALRTAGTIIVPGWSDRSHAPPVELINELVAAHRRGARMVSICSGVFALAATGLLDGKPATTHWRYIDELHTLYPAIDIHPDVLYVDNGSILTSAGSAAGIDLGLHIIRNDYGADIANRVARRMVVPPHRDGGQAQFIPQPVANGEDASISSTLEWALERLDEPLTTRILADHASLTERTFARRFAEATGTTPHRWLSANRLRRARDLLETTTISIDRVAEMSGLGSAANLRHHFKHELHTTPTKYRTAFASRRLSLGPQ